jgi:hypothetical protein
MRRRTSTRPDWVPRRLRLRLRVVLAIAAPA